MADDSEAETDGGEPEEPQEADDAPTDGNGAPAVKLRLYELEVSVTGTDADELEAVGREAESLMEYLVEQHHELNEAPDGHEVF